MDLQCKNSTSFTEEDESSCNAQLQVKYSVCVFPCLKNFLGCNYFGSYNFLFKKEK